MSITGAWADLWHHLLMCWHHKHCSSLLVVFKPSCLIIFLSLAAADSSCGVCLFAGVATDHVLFLLSFSVYCLLLIKLSQHSWALYYILYLVVITWSCRHRTWSPNSHDALGPPMGKMYHHVLMRRFYWSLQGDAFIALPSKLRKFRGQGQRQSSSQARHHGHRDVKTSSSSSKHLQVWVLKALSIFYWETTQVTVTWSSNKVELQFHLSTLSQTKSSASGSLL